MGTLLIFQFYDEDSNRVGTLYECGLYLRFYGICYFILKYVKFQLSILLTMFITESNGLGPYFQDYGEITTNYQTPSSDPIFNCEEHEKGPFIKYVNKERGSQGTVGRFTT